MTPQEQQMIDGLIERIRNTQITDRDPVAASHLQQGLGANPDSIYILAQTVLVQQHSLEQAHSQLDQMEAQLKASQSGGQFQTAQQPVPSPTSGPSNWLNRFFGDGSSSPSQPYGQQPPPQYSGPSQPTYAASAPGYQPVSAGQQPQYGVPGYSQPGYGQPGYAQPGYAQQGLPPQAYAQASYPQQGYAPQGYTPQGYGSPWGQPGGIGGGGSFLRTAAMTAAGVAAGEMLFQGVEGMFSGHHSGYGNSGHDSGSVVNNYYEDREPVEHHRAADTDSSFYNPEHDASRSADGESVHHSADAPSAPQDGSSSGIQHFADTSDSGVSDSDAGNDAPVDGGDSYDDSSADDAGADEIGSDDSGSDDGGSYDDSSN